ncbi:MAG TPA: rhomboid family intramembrane serine protease, partial [Vicinamibacteria bacterium]|nr:rhomboid family intramembrane serine protease [Vicinamibacteria bacterium]
LPVGDAPNPKGFPFVTYTLIALNVAAFLLINVPLGSRRADVSDPAFREYVEVMARELQGRADVREIVARTSAYDLFSFEHGYRPAAPQVADLLSCMFLHGGLMHLFGNMLFLWIYGDNVERRLGALPFLLAYLLTGVAATLTHSLVFSSSDIPLVGASGAISGVLGFYFLWFPRNTVRMLAFLPPFLMQVFEIPARWVLGMYLLVDNLLPFLFAGEGGVAHGAHIGGFVAGGLAAWLVDRRGVAARPADIEAPEAPPAGAGAVRAALAAGRFEEASRAYFALPAPSARGALSAEEAVELASWLRRGGHADAALLLLRRVVRDVPRGEGLAEVYALAGIILLEDRHEPAAAYQYLLTALELEPRPETAAAVRQELLAIEELQKRRVGRLHAPPRW